jgi:phospholipase/lecithinase/hemolysin
MKRPTIRSKWAHLLGTLALGCAFTGVADAGARTPYTALYVFGDSYSDIGARYLDGNGPTPPAYLAQRMGIQLTFPDDPDAGKKSLDFAATAATTGADPGKGRWCCRGMLDQVNDFASRVRSGALSFDPKVTLFFLAGGLNDADLSTDVTIGNLTQEIQILKDLGGRHFTLALLPTEVPDFAAVGTRLNPAYRALVTDLRKRQGIDIRLNNWGRYLDEILRNPAAHGLTNTSAPCAGRALFHQDATPCAAPDTYFYFHSGHPSAAVNRIVGEKLYRDLSAGERATTR